MNNVRVLELLNEAGRYIYGYENHAKKDEAAFAKAVEVFKESDTIIFNSMITNEEAMILQKLKQMCGFQLVNKEAKKFQEFLNNFASVSAKQLYSGSLQAIETCNAAIILGCSVSTDNQKLLASLKIAHNEKDAYITYMHPLVDEPLKNLVSQHIKYEVGSEEGLMAMLADLLICEEGKKKYQSFFDELDVGYICGESSVGEEEFDEINEKLLQQDKRVLVIGSDLYNHPRAKNIAKILGMISKYSDLEVVMITPEVNTLGVALICDLDDAVEGKSIGYNLEADYSLSFLGEGNLDMPSLIQQEGTFTSLDKKVLALKASASYEGYALNDIAKALGLDERTIDYTAKLPVTSGYKAVTFNELEDQGYDLENLDVKNGDDTIEDVDDICEFNGSVVYRCNHPLSLFNPDTSKAHQINDDLVLLGSKQFATAAKMKAGSMVRFEMDGKTYQRKFKVSEDLKGTIAYNPVFDSTDNYDEYRYKSVNLEEVNE